LNLTIAICTWNRAALLAAALDALKQAVSRAAAPPEIIVVDNNSTDATVQVIAEAGRELPLRYLFQATPGLSHARNAAVEAASGDFIAWIDDDVVVGTDWLRAYEAALIERPHAAFFGGPVRPVLLGEPPRWLSQAWSRVDRVFAAIDLAAEPFEIRSTACLPYGANFACRTDLQRAFPYDPDLGRRPADYWRAGEEHALLRQLLETGHSGWWLPDAAVQHVIGPDRQGFRAFMAHGFGNGRTQARLNPLPSGEKTWFGYPQSLLKMLARVCGETLVSTLGKEPYAWVPKCYEVSVLAGRLRGSGT
jgi:glycosyltransferase involved in cell wall biosynthesis